MRAGHVTRAVVQRDESGQALVEYALVLSFVSIAAVVVLTTIGGDVSSLISSVAKAF